MTLRVESKAGTTGEKPKDLPDVQVCLGNEVRGRVELEAGAEFISPRAGEPSRVRRYRKYRSLRV